MIVSYLWCSSTTGDVVSSTGKGGGLIFGYTSKETRKKTIVLAL